MHCNKRTRPRLSVYFHSLGTANCIESLEAIETTNNLSLNLIQQGSSHGDTASNKLSNTIESLTQSSNSHHRGAGGVSCKVSVETTVVSCEQLK